MTEASKTQIKHARIKIEQTTTDTYIKFLEKESGYALYTGQYKQVLTPDAFYHISNLWENNGYVDDSLLIGDLTKKQFACRRLIPMPIKTFIRLLKIDTLINE